MAPDKELTNLLSLVVDVNNRIDALKQEKDQYRDRIRLLMDDSGQSNFQTPEGRISFKRRRTLSVYAPHKLTELFSSDVLATYFKPTIDFVEAARREKVDVDSAITIGISETLEVSQTRGAEATERRRSMIAESKKEAEQTIVKLQERIRKSSKKETA